MGMAMGAGTETNLSGAHPRNPKEASALLPDPPESTIRSSDWRNRGVSLAVLASLFSAVHLPPNYVLPVYVAAVTTIALAVTVISLLGLRGRFTGRLVNDPSPQVSPPSRRGRPLEGGHRAV